MSENNRISLQIPVEDQTAINDAIVVLQTKLIPLLKDLTPKERMDIPKMGDKTLAFVTKAYTHIEQNPTLVPAYMDSAQMKIDLDAVEELKKMLTPLKQVTELVDDSYLLSGSEAFISSLHFYNYVKGASKAGVPGTQVIYDDLKARFPGRSSK